MSSAFPGSQLLDGFLHIGHVRLGEKWVSGLDDLKRDAVFSGFVGLYGNEIPCRKFAGNFVYEIKKCFQRLY